jgi:2'-5' RNA ligase
LTDSLTDTSANSAEAGIDGIRQNLAYGSHLFGRPTDEDDGNVAGLFALPHSYGYFAAVAGHTGEIDDEGIGNGLADGGHDDGVTAGIVLDFETTGTAGFEDRVCFFGFPVKYADSHGSHDRIIEVRLFTGIAVAQTVRNQVERLMTQWRDVPWVAPDNLHITTKFIGAWPEEKVPELEDALGKAARPGPFEIRIAGSGTFQKTVYARVQAGPELAMLTQSLDEALAAIGCPRETRPYTPHLTLARVKHQTIDTLDKMVNTDFGSFEAEEFHLYLSKGGVYTKLVSFPLDGRPRA